MAKQHYEGKLGTFDYNDEEFELIDEQSFESDGIYGDDNTGPIFLHYIGTEKDGSKIHVPEGLKNADFLFAACDTLVTAPELPEGIESCVQTFESCGSLKKPSAIPKGVKNCGGMFWNCESLEEASVIPEGVEQCDLMFRGCEALETAPSVPKGVRNCSEMFRNCRNLRTVSELSDGIEDCFAMFAGCNHLKSAPEIPDTVKNCNYMFAGCEALEMVPKQSINAIYCESMFEDCMFLKNVPSLNGVEVCDRMFADCNSIQDAPVIPESVKTCKGMFHGCMDSIQIAGGWNIQNRGKDYYREGPGRYSRFGYNNHEIDALKAVYVNDISIQNIQKLSGVGGNFYSVSIPVSSKMSEDGRAIISCSRGNITSHGGYVDLMLDDSNEKYCSVVKNGNRSIIKVKPSDLAIAHAEKAAQYRKSISTMSSKGRGLEYVGDSQKGLGE